MGTITSTVKVGQKPPKDVVKRVRKAVREARKATPIYDPDCPPSSPEALKEFAQLAAERNRRKKKKTLSALNQILNVIKDLCELSDIYMV